MTRFCQHRSSWKGPQEAGQAAVPNPDARLLRVWQRLRAAGASDAPGELSGAPWLCTRERKPASPCPSGTARDPGSHLGAGLGRDPRRRTDTQEVRRARNAATAGRAIQQRPLWSTRLSPNPWGTCYHTRPIVTCPSCLPPGPPPPRLSCGGVSTRAACTWFPAETPPTRPLTGAHFRSARAGGGAQGKGSRRRLTSSLK